MARQVKLDRYPPQFKELADRFEKNPSRTIEISINYLSTHISAQSLQLELQAFRSALRKHPEFEHQYPEFFKAEIGKNKDKSKVYIARKDKSPTGLLVQNALEDIDIESEK